MATEPENWWDPFHRTAKERAQAREFMVNYAPNGEFEISVCARCGLWTIWDGQLIEPGGLKCVVGYRNHLVSRVKVKVL